MELEQLLAEQDALLVQREEALAEAAHQLADIRQSFGYRLLQAYRRGIRRLFPPGSWRGRPYVAFKSAIRRLLTRQ